MEEREVTWGKEEKNQATSHYKTGFDNERRIVE